MTQFSQFFADSLMTAIMGFGHLENRLLTLFQRKSVKNVFELRLNIFALVLYSIVLYWTSMSVLFFTKKTPFMELLTSDRK